MSTEARTAPQPRAGDPLPSAVGALLAAFAAGDAEAGAGCFAVDATWAVPGDEANETAPRAVHEGREAIAAALAADPQLGRAHDVRVAVVEGVDCMVEGEVLGDDGTPVRCYAASVQLDPEGRIARALVFRCDPVVDNAGTDGENPSGTEIQRDVDDYFHELDSGHFEAATTFFSADVAYLHPPYSPGSPRVAFHGTAELLAGFQHRGVQTWEHFTDVSIQRGPHLLFEGHALIDGTPEGPSGQNICSATVDEQGKVLRYLAFYSADTVPRR